MECTRPRRISLDPDNKFDPREIFVPCGKCLACRINRRREWTQRLLHEASNSSSAYFVTLTYNEDYLPYNEETGEPKVSKTDVQEFFQNLRNACRKDLVKIRYFIGSEYGDLGRPHYHAIIFNLPRRFIDLPCKDWRPGLPLATKKGKYISLINRQLNDIWQKGFVSIGELNRQRCGYCAKYFVDKADYPDGGVPNFSLMSRRPGIGSDYAESISSKVRYYGLHSCLADNGKYLKLPRYYDKKIFTDEERKARLTDELLANLSQQVLESDVFDSADVVEYEIRKFHNFTNPKKQL